MVLASRYLNDGKPVIPLNNIQLRYKKKLEDKINSGKYSFEKVNCIVCNSNEFEKLAEKDRYGLQMTTVICLKCGLIQTNPRMNEISYNEFYDMEYRKLYDGLPGEPKKIFNYEYSTGKGIYKRLQRVLGNVIEGKFVVEIGTGAGGILKFFQDKGNQVFGFDLGSSWIEYGKKQGLELEIGGLEKLLTLTKKPDIVICSQIVEHFLNPVEALKKIRGCLKPEGVILVEVPGVLNLHKSYYQDFLKFLQNAHTYHFTLNSLINCCKKAGFKLVVGDDTISSVFKIDKVDNNYESDYKSTKNFLVNLQKSKSLAIKLKVFSIIIPMLKKAKLVDVSRDLVYKYNKIKGSYN